MTGGKESIIGFDKEDFLGLFLDRRPVRIGVSKGPTEFNAVVIEVDVESRRATSIERVYREHM
jgi:calcineurin-like phosphoesterase